MSVLEVRSLSTGSDGLDIAGTVWPLYKLEALAVGFLVLAALFVLIGTAQTAVLGAAAATTVVWWGRRIHYRRRRP